MYSKIAQILNEYKSERLITELAKTNRLILLDVDDTLLKPEGVFIYRKLPSDKEEIALTPYEYGLEKVTPETKQYYDYRDFIDPVKTQQSIEMGKPIVANLSVMDDYLKRGYQIGILTARANEEEVFQALKNFLMYKDKRGELIPVGDRLNRNLVFAINDSNRRQQLQSTTDYGKKAEVVTRLLNDFDEIVFVDDDMKNLKAMFELKSDLPDMLSNKLFFMLAKE